MTNSQNGLFNTTTTTTTTTTTNNNNNNNNNNIERRLEESHEVETIFESSPWTVNGGITSHKKKTILKQLLCTV
jgi:hypothetical protein